MDFRYIAIDGPIGVGGGMTYDTLLTDYEPHSYKNTSAWRREVLLPFITSLAATGDTAGEANATSGTRSLRKGDVPRADSNLRLVAGADRAPVLERC